MTAMIENLCARDACHLIQQANPDNTAIHAVCDFLGKCLVNGHALAEVDLSGFSEGAEVTRKIGQMLRLAQCLQG